MSNDTAISNVSDTSYWVAYYRQKESERPDALFHDPFAKKLGGEHAKKIAESMSDMGRYTEWAVVSRTVIIDRFIEKAVKEGVDAVVNLGAGLDARPYRMNLPTSLEWIEVDYPNIVAHKNEVLKNEKPKCNLSRVEVDLADEKARKAFLANVAPNAKKILVLTEGVIPYLSPEQVADLANDLLAQKRVSLWITEYFDKRVYPYLKTTVRELKMKNAPFLFYPENWFAFFKALGWVSKETRYTGEIALEFKRKIPMPRWVEIIFAFLPKKAKEDSLRMTGYVLFEKA